MEEPQPKRECTDELSYTRGPYPLDMAMFKENRGKLVARFESEQGLLLFQGGEGKCRHETDHEPVFRQQSTFQYLFGVREPDCFGVIEVPTGRTTLYVPRLPESYAIWMGKIQPPSHFQEYYQVDRCLHVDEMAADIAALSPSVIHTTKGLNTDSGAYAEEAAFEGIERFTVDSSRLYYEVVECRVLKSARELALLQFANDVSSDAHLRVMAAAKGLQREHQLESRFLAHCYEYGACRHPGYTCICACGPNGAVLHYGHAGAPNDAPLPEGAMCLLDMGGEAHCYGADITCSFPKNGVFNARQRALFEAVRAMQVEVMRAVRPGAAWPALHELACRVLCERLKALGLLVGEVEAMMAANLGAVFMPHGLGHLLGLDTHDVGGFPTPRSAEALAAAAAGKPLPWPPERDPRAGYRSLRLVRVLAAGMVVTVEPGIYFIDVCLDQALADPARARFLAAEELATWRGAGGVRLEDNLVVTEGGARNLTRCPRTVEEVEAVMAGRITHRRELVSNDQVW
mmetsp:Transcript_25135/g.41548  ORF Transcript_25135/g.41548 Transcript_25135/m.41548 type:complete len:515 (-) Transcript_25135:490-2034(-)